MVAALPRIAAVATMCRAQHATAVLLTSCCCRCAVTVTGGGAVEGDEWWWLVGEKLEMGGQRNREMEREVS